MLKHKIQILLHICMLIFRLIFFIMSIISCQGVSAQILGYEANSSGEKERVFIFYYNGKDSEYREVIRENRHEMKELEDLLSSAELENNTVKQIRITCYSSIEGTWNDNKELVEKRLINFTEYLSARTGIEEEKFVTRTVPEDWDGLVQFIDTDAYMPMAGQVNEIILTTDVMKGRERKLMELNGGNPYRYMKANYFYQLERVECTVIR